MARDQFQKKAIIGELRAAHGQPVSVEYLIDRWGITRAATYINELRDAGWVIETINPHRLGNGSMSLSSYRLIQEPGREGIQEVQTSLFPDLPTQPRPTHDTLKQRKARM